MERLNIVNIIKMIIPPKAIYRFNVIPIKIPWHFCRNENPILKFIRNFKLPQTAKAILKKIVGGLSLPDFKATSNQNSVVLAVGRHIDQRAQK